MPENCLLSDVKLLDGEVYVTVPRWRHGVPSSLNRLQDARQRSPLLVPYPNWKMNEPGDAECSAIQYAHAIEIDPLRRMWIVDSGKWGTFTRPDSRCPAKLVVWDIERGRELRRFVFSDELVDRAQSLLASIVLDTTSTAPDEWHAYIASTGESRLLVYSWREDRAWFLSHRRSMGFDHSAIMIQTMPPATLPLGIASLALSPHRSPHHWSYNVRYNRNYNNYNNEVEDSREERYSGVSSGHQLFFAPLASYQFYSVATSLLRNRSRVEALPISDLDPSWDQLIRRVGVRSSQSAAMTVSASGIMYYSVLNNNAINKWNLSEPFSALDLVFRDDQRLQWPAAFGWGGGGFLYFTSNRMQLYVHHDLHRQRVNFRIMRAKMGTPGYMGVISAANHQISDYIAVCFRVLVAVVIVGRSTSRIGSY